MNIFYVHTDPIIAAQSLCDKHVVKMILESAQILCTAHHELGSMGPFLIPYKATHKNHPSNKWIRQCSDHYIWLYEHYLALCNEYTHRYGKIHKSEHHKYNLIYMPCYQKDLEKFIPPPQCMPDEYKCDNTVLAYRKYYKYGKAHILKYTKREAPEWLTSPEV